ncbi:MAG: helix-turn-helix transcriptional regulator [Bacillota bacterium]|nr:helix-turn-helix transcriptional regulator [Bacillota bacterium]
MENRFITDLIGNKMIQMQTNDNDSILIDMLTMEVVYDIIYGNSARIKMIRGEEEIEAQVKGTDKSYVVLLISIDHFWKTCENMDNKERYITKRKLLNCVRETLENKYISATTSLIGTEKLIVLLDVSSFKSKKDFIIKKIAHAIRRSILNNSQYTATIAASQDYASVRELWKGYEEAFQLINKVFFYSENFVITCNSSTKNFLPKDTIEVIEYQLFENFSKSNKEETIICFKKMCKLSSNEAIYNQDTLKSKISSLLFRIAKYCTDAGVNSALVNNQLTEVITEIIKAHKISQIEEMGQRFLIQLHDEIVLLTENDIRVGFNKITAFSKEFYHKDLRVDEMANMVNVSTSYFCRKFREFYGLTFIDYITNLRLDAAKGFLENTYLSISDISIAVGFNDTTYFSRSFKKKYGVAPSYYRKQKKYR